MSRTPDNKLLVLGTTRRDHDGGMAEVLETAGGASKPPHKTDCPTLEYLRTKSRKWCT